MRGQHSAVYEARQKYLVSIHGTPITFSVPDGQPVLEGALRQGVWLRHGCSHGECGSCKARVIEGEYELLDSVSPYALLPHEIDEGWTLLCSTLAFTDLTIVAEVDEHSGQGMFPVADYTAMVMAGEWLGESMWWVRAKIQQSDLRYHPGQYFELAIPPAGDEKRAYSFCRASSDAEGCIEFLVKVVPQGRGSQYVQSLRPGDRISLTAPFGTTIAMPGDEPLVLIAGGSGIGPARALLEHSARNEPDRDVWLFFGARSEPQLVWHKEFQSWVQENSSRRHYIVVLSDETDDTRWEGERGLIGDFVERTLPHFGDQPIRVYLFGPLPMVRSVRQVLQHHGVDSEHIHADEF